MQDLAIWLRSKFFWISVTSILVPAAVYALPSVTPPSPLQIETMSQHPEWRKLLHWQTDLLGRGHSAVEGENFFLSRDGSTSLQSELKASIEHFFSGSVAEQEKYQCAFLARRDFIASQMHLGEQDLQPCPQFTSWIQRLNPQSLTLVFASESLGNPASSFGHIFLKLHDPKRPIGEELLDYGINYAARTEKVTGALYAWYGLFGFFPGSYGMAPYHHLIKEYTNLEGRDLWEYDLNLQPNEIQHLLKHLLELEKGYFNYYFLNENCANLIAVALEIARPSISVSSQHAAWVLPLDVVKKVNGAGLVVNKHYRPSLQTIFSKSFAPLPVVQKEKIALLSKNALLDNSTTRKTIIDELSTPAISSAQNFFALKGGKNTLPYQAVNYELAVARSKRTDPGEIEEFFPPASPDEGPSSSLFSISLLSQNSNSGAEIGIRAVGYDLLSPEPGVAPFSVFELGAISMQFTQLQQSFLSDLKPLNVLTSHPVDAISVPISWGIQLERQQWWQLSLRSGLSFDLPIFRGGRWMNFALVEVQEAVLNQSSLGVGFDSVLPIHLSKAFRILLDDQLIYNLAWQNQATAALAWQIATNTEVRFTQNAASKLSLNLYF